ncbi:MAG: amidohydrolase family protein [Gammaproteobacteria bacterium]
MHFVDSDAHVIETEATWDFLDPAERDLRPRVANACWWIEDQCIPLEDPTIQSYIDAYPPGSVTMTDPTARVARMDALGVDVQVLFSTLWVNYEFGDAMLEAALARSYNRWMAEVTAASRGRLRWTAFPPWRTTQRALEELDYARAHGAVGVHLRGVHHGRGISDPMLHPIFERAQDLDLAITVHVGGDLRRYMSQPAYFLYNNILPVPAAFAAVVLSGLPKKFPRLRWLFVEAGAGWLPYVLQETFRADVFGAVRNFREWRKSVDGFLAANNLYVACQMDDDIPYLLNYAGPDNLVLGTDYGHLDVGTDPDALRIVSQRPDLAPDVARRIVDTNARRLYGL